MRFAKVILLAPLAAGSPFGASHAPVPRNEEVSYDGHRIYSITSSSAIEAHNLASRFSRYHTHHVRDTFSVVIPPDEVLSFESLGLNARLVNSNLGAHIRNIDSKATSYNRAFNKRGELPDLSWFDDYHPYADHLDYWDSLMHAFPENSKKLAIGKSYENRTMHAFHLFGDKGSDKPIILWHATVHSREWISTMVIEYLAHQLIAGYKTGNADVIAFLDHFDFYLVPFANPDGFVYSQTTDRMWRKTREPHPSLNTTCIGTDGNRNWKFEWEGDETWTTDPCGETFRGLTPGDTPENIALDGLSTMLATQGKGIRSYIDFHSYNEQILTPWGYTCDTRPATNDRMLEVGKGMAHAITAASERNSSYAAAPGCEILYLSTGCSRDHHYAVHGANHSWSIELSPRDDGAAAGFVLDPKEIGPVVRELWAGQLWLLREVWND